MSTKIGRRGEGRLAVDGDGDLASGSELGEVHGDGRLWATDHTGSGEVGQGDGSCRGVSTSRRAFKAGCSCGFVGGASYVVLGLDYTASVDGEGKEAQQDRGHHDCEFGGHGASLGLGRARHRWAADTNCSIDSWVWAVTDQEPKGMIEGASPVMTTVTVPVAMSRSTVTTVLVRLPAWPRIAAAPL